MRKLSSAKSYVRLSKKRSFLTVFTLLALSLGGIFTCQAPALAQTAAQTSALASLENHFFEHTYLSDSPEDRVTRLEKMVFGEAKSGDTAARIADLQKVVSSSETDLTAQNSASNTSTSKSGTTGSAQAKAAGQPAKSDDDDPALANTDYPRVDMLEEVIFGQEYKQMSLKKRLVQLETKVFGRPSTDDDLSARTDALEMHWQKTLAAAVQSQYDRDLSWLETQVIGQTYPQKPFIERIQTLEGIVFPNDQQNYHTAMKDQIAALVNAVHLNSQSGHPTTPSVTPIDQGPDSGTAANYQGYGQGSSAQTADSRPAPLNPYRTGSSANYASTGVPYNSGSRSYQASPLAQEFAREPSGDDSAYNPNYSTPSGYPQPAHSYPGQPAQAAYNTQQSYPGASTPVNTAMPTQAQTQEPKQQGHPLLKGLAHALGSAAMVGASMMQNMNLNYGGYGYGSPYGMSGYGGMPMGYGGMGSYGMGYGGVPGYGIRF